jgi:hypothetical protein
MEGERTTRIHCNRCSTQTSHRLLADKTLWGWHEEPVADFVDHPDEADWREDYELLQCCGCDDVCLKHSTRDISISPEVPPIVHFYPPRSFRRRPNWFSNLPPDIEAVLNEVYSALASDSPRLAAMGFEP